MSYKAIVSDIDGTLLGADGVLSPRDVAAVEELTRRGVIVTLCTGRMYSGTRGVAAALRIQEPLGCIDGSHIVHASTGVELHNSPLERLGVHGLFDELERHGPAAFVFASDRVYFDADGSHYLPYVSTWSDQTHQLSSALDRDHWDETRPISALIALGHREQIENVHQFICANHPERFQSAHFPIQRESFDGVWGLIVRAARVNKGTALEWLATHYGITPEEMVTIGDWFNDVPMLQRAGCSFAMAQAPAEVKAAAKVVLDTDIWRGGGLMEAAERAGLL